MRTLAPLFVLSLVAACSSPADDFRGVLPDDRLLIDEASFSDLARGVGEPSEAYVLTRDVTSEVNAGLGDVLRLVDTITGFNPTWTDGGDTALWGPWLDDGVYGQLWMTRNADTGFTWAIELRPEASAEDAWVAVIAGEIDAGSDADHSSGHFVMDFTGIEDAGAGDGVTGQLAAEYELVDNGAIATVAFGEISEDGSIPQDAGYHYEHTKGAGGFMDLAIEEDVDPTDGTLELVVLRSRWDAAGAGRSDALVTGGTLGPLTYTESECWSAAHTTVFLENNYELSSEGDEATCAFADAIFPD